MRKFYTSACLIDTENDFVNGESHGVLKQRILIAEENGESDVQLLNATATYCGERANGYEAGIAGKISFVSSEKVCRNVREIRSARDEERRQSSAVESGDR